MVDSNGLLYMRKSVDLMIENSQPIIQLIDDVEVENKNLILAIYLTEQLHRGGVTISIIEKILAKYFSKLLLKLDYSIGPFQIKPSFSKKYGDSDFEIIDLFCYKKCIVLLKEFLEFNNELDDLQLINLYHSGQYHYTFHETIMYQSLYEYVKEKEIFE